MTAAAAATDAQAQSFALVQVPPPAVRARAPRVCVRPRACLCACAPVSSCTRLARVRRACVRVATAAAAASARVCRRARRRRRQWSNVLAALQFVRDPTRTQSVAHVRRASACVSSTGFFSRFRFNFFLLLVNETIFVVLSCLTLFVIVTPDPYRRLCAFRKFSRTAYQLP